MPAAIQNFVVPAFDQIHAVCRAAQPLQPFAAALKIVGTAAWKQKNQAAIQKKIRRLHLAITILKKKAELHPPAREEINKILPVLRAERKELELQFRKGTISFLDLPCLLFEHPGSNAWKSCTNLAGRICSLCYQLSWGKRQRILCDAPLSTIAQLGCGAISLLGTAFSLLKQVGAIEQNDDVSEGVISAAFAVQTAESCWLAYQTALNLLKNGTKRKDC